MENALVSTTGMIITNDSLLTHRNKKVMILVFPHFSRFYYLEPNGM